MKSNYASKVSTFLLSGIFMVIIVSFLFSGYDSSGGNFQMGPTSKEVANVDGTPITIREFQMRMGQQVEFFNQMMGGKMTQAQLEQMGIKETVLNGLIQQKLLLNAGKRMGMMAATDEVRQEIRNLPFFQTNNQFDVNRYKSLLTMNQYTPAEFEEMTANDVLTRRIEEMLNNMTVSPSLVADIMRYKTSAAKVQVLKLNRGELTPLITVSEEEIKTFASDANNKKQLEELYAENTTKYVKPEEIKARHILLRSDDPATDADVKKKADDLMKELTVSNFQTLAKKHTDDPSGKNTGGDLGWFARGRMVPEFEKAAFDAKLNTITGPIKTIFGYHIVLVENRKAEQRTTLEQATPELARQALQRRKATELTKLMEETQAKLTAAMEKNDTATIESFKKQASMQWFPTSSVNRYDLTVGGITFTAEEGQKIFTAQAGSVLNFGGPAGIFLVKVVEPNTTASTDGTSAETERQTLAAQTGKKAREELLKEMNTNAKIQTNPAAL